MRSMLIRRGIYSAWYFKDSEIVKDFILGNEKSNNVYTVINKARKNGRQQLEFFRTFYSTKSEKMGTTFR